MKSNRCHCVREKETTSMDSMSFHWTSIIFHQIDDNASVKLVWKWIWRRNRFDNVSKCDRSTEMFVFRMFFHNLNKLNKIQIGSIWFDYRKSKLGENSKNSSVHFVLSRSEPILQEFLKFQENFINAKKTCHSLNEPI